MTLFVDTPEKVMRRDQRDRSMVGVLRLGLILAFWASVIASLAYIFAGFLQLEDEAPNGSWIPPHLMSGEATSPPVSHAPKPQTSPKHSVPAHRAVLAAKSIPRPHQPHHGHSKGLQKKHMGPSRGPVNSDQGNQGNQDQGNGQILPLNISPSLRMLLKK